MQTLYFFFFFPSHTGAERCDSVLGDCLRAPDSDSALEQLASLFLMRRRRARWGARRLHLPASGRRSSDGCCRDLVTLHFFQTLCSEVDLSLSSAFFFLHLKTSETRNYKEICCPLASLAINSKSKHTMCVKSTKTSLQTIRCQHNFSSPATSKQT